MTEIRKAGKEDFEQIYPLLSEFDNPYICKDDWRRIFNDNWDAGEGYCGYVMLEKDRAVGFLGLLFSRRHLRGENRRFCHLTTWIVKEEHRGKSLFLLLPILKLTTHVLVDLTPSSEVRALLAKGKFEVFETHYRLILPVPDNPFHSVDCTLITEDSSAGSRFSDFEMKIYKDHRFPHCRHLHIKSPRGSCYVVATRMVRRKIPFLFGQIHYISNSQVFYDCVKRARYSLFSRLNVRALLVDERLTGHRYIPVSIKRKLKEPRMFKSPDLSGEDVDTLYSESILLNI